VSPLIFAAMLSVFSHQRLIVAVICAATANYKRLERHPDGRCSLVPAEPRTDHDDEVAVFDLAEPMASSKAIGTQAEPV
jgi:hypothetical protein